MKLKLKCRCGDDYHYAKLETWKGLGFIEIVDDFSYCSTWNIFKMAIKFVLTKKFESHNVVIRGKDKSKLQKFVDEIKEDM